MILFGVEYLLALIIALGDNKKNRRIILIIFAIFTFIFAFRKITMNQPGDIEEYRYYYNNIHNSLVLKRYDFELGYYVFNLIFSFFHLPFEMIQITIGIFFSVMLYKCSEYYTGKPGICLFASLFFLYYYATGALRQSVAIPIAFYSFRFLLEDDKEHIDRKKINIFENINTKHYNLIIYCVLMFICFAFHRASIFLLLVPVIRTKKGKFIVLAVSLGFSVLFPYFEIFLIHFPKLYSKYSFYRYSGVDRGYVIGFSFRLLEYLIIIFLLFFKKNKGEADYFSIDLLLLGVMVQVILSRYITTSYRFLQFTDIGIVLFAGNYYKTLKEPVKQFIYICIIAFLVFYRFYSVLSANSGLGLHYSLIGF